MTTTYRNGGQICGFWPDNTDTCFYLYGHHTFLEIWEMCERKFGENVNTADIKIETEHIHTRCLGFDSYDSSDWDTFLVITYDPTI